MESISSRITLEDKEILIKILKNVLDHPQQSKYKNLNEKRISTKFVSPNNSSIDLLLSLGFKRSGNRLILSENSIYKIKKLYTLFINDVLLTKIIELMRLNVPFDEAQSAVAMSLNSDHRINTDLDMDEAVKCLINHGFAINDSMDAIVDANYDIKHALDLLVHRNTDTATLLDSIEDSKETENDRKYSQLISMGFDGKLSMNALKRVNFDVNAAVQHIIHNNMDRNPFEVNYGCSGGIGSMKHCTHLSTIKQSLNASNKDTQLDIISTLNSFHHLMNEHDSNEEFEEIYHILSPCDITKCNIFRRNHRDRNKKDINVSYIDDIIDKIHCYFKHSYDIGFRLTPNETKQIETTVFEEKYNDNQQSLTPLLKLRKIKPIKHKQIKPYISNDKISNKSKFNDYDQYNFGERFVYWDRCKNHHHNITKKNGRDYSFIHPKFKSLKQELTQNPYAIMAVEQWNNEYCKATKHKNSYNGKHLIAMPDMYGSSRDPQGGLFTDHKIYEIAYGSPIEIHHLLAIIIYCGYTVICYEFRKTYRSLDKDDHTDDDWKRYVSNSQQNSNNIQWNYNYYNKTEIQNESNASIKGRHCKFYHFAKYLNELIHVYSPPIWLRARQAGAFNTFYHGINKEMKFRDVIDAIHQPFSTTSSFEVAMHFSTVKGMVLELTGSGWSRYFECSWISDFPSERELFFINHVGFLTFTNITNISTGCEYDEFMKAIAIIECVITGQPFQPDTKVIENIRKCKNIVDGLNLIRNGAKPIDPILKMFTLRLIKHELHRYNAEKYNTMEYMHIDEYIEELLHYICIKRDIVHIDWTLMSMEIIDRYTGGGYNGFAFLKSLFCKENLRTLDLDFITLLFPNVKYIALVNGTIVSTKCVEYILDFLKKKQTKDLVGVSIICDQVNVPNWSMFNAMFDEMGWVLQILPTIKQFSVMLSSKMSTLFRLLKKEVYYE